MSLFICGDFDDVLANTGESSSVKVGFSVVCECFLVELCFEEFQGQGKVEDDSVVDSLTFDYGASECNTGACSESGSLSELHCGK